VPVIIFFRIKEARGSTALCILYDSNEAKRLLCNL